MEPSNRARIALGLPVALPDGSEQTDSAVNLAPVADCRTTVRVSTRAHFTRPTRRPAEAQAARSKRPIGLVLGRGRNGGTIGRAGPGERVTDGRGSKGEWCY